MKKVLLAGTALVGAALVASPAHADGLKLDLGGYFRGYAVYTDNDEQAGVSDRKFDFKKDTEVSFGGETTTDNGLTVGVHSELKMGSNDFTTGSAIDPFFGQAQGAAFSGLNSNASASQTDEAYAYFSGGWGRINFGQEDGAAYLLQVAAPSADSNVDGLRVAVQSFDASQWTSASALTTTTGRTNIVLGYDQADFRQVDRLTYLTPKFNGFQAGLSYAPKANTSGYNYSTSATPVDNNSSNFDNLWELAARWDGEFQGFGISAGAGYSDATAQNSAATGAGNFGSDNLATYNVGLNVAFQGFSLGGAYKHSNTGTSGSNNAARTWVVGAGWDNGPYHVGASWLNTKLDSNAYGLALNDDLKLNRYTVGGGYTFGPGMTFRGAVALLDVNNGSDATPEPNQYQVTLGTDINF